MAVPTKEESEKIKKDKKDRAAITKAANLLKTIKRTPLWDKAGKPDQTNR